MRRLIVLLTALIALALAAPACAADRPMVLLISIDGFRADYLYRGHTPNLLALAKRGVTGTMRPSFPSKTFPNHYALVTGLRPDRNGIVDNTMEDPAIPGVTFRMSNADAVRDRRWWDEGEPIWVTAERAGIRAATMFWPGSEAAVRGVRPSYWRPFDMKVTPDQRVDQVLAWADLPAAERPRLVTLYFDDVDSAGHNFGPFSSEVDAATARVDAAIGRLLAGLDQRGLPVNVVVVADHGMAGLSPDRVSYLEDVLSPDAYRALGSGAFMTIYPNPGRDSEVDRALIQSHANYQCWRKAEIPARFHYGRNRRVAPYFCLPETGWLLLAKRSASYRFEKGTHGFDPESPQMAALFVAAGPGLKSGVVVRPFDNVDVQPLLAHLLGVRVAATDGRLGSFRAGLVWSGRVLAY